MLNSINLKTTASILAPAATGSGIMLWLDINSGAIGSIVAILMAIAAISNYLYNARMTNKRHALNQLNYEHTISQKNNSELKEIKESLEKLKRRKTDI